MQKEKEKEIFSYSWISRHVNNLPRLTKHHLLTILFNNNEQLLKNLYSSNRTKRTEKNRQP